MKTNTSALTALMTFLGISAIQAQDSTLHTNLSNIVSQDPFQQLWNRLGISIRIIFPSLIIFALLVTIIFFKGKADNLKK